MKEKIEIVQKIVNQTKSEHAEIEAGKKMAPDIPFSKSKEGKEKGKNTRAYHPDKPTNDSPATSD